MTSPKAKMFHENIRSYEAEQSRLEEQIAKLKDNPKMVGEVHTRRLQQQMLQANIDSLVAELRKLSALE